MNLPRCRLQDDRLGEGRQGDLSSFQRCFHIWRWQIAVALFCFSLAHTWQFLVSGPYPLRWVPEGFCGLSLVPPIRVNFCEVLLEGRQGGGTPVSVSEGCHNKVPRTGSLKPTHIEWLIVLEAGSLKLRCWPGHAPLTPLGENPSLPLPSFRGFAGSGGGQSSALLASAAPLLSLPLPLCLSVCSYKLPVILD